jgi:CSLREA domain-containing protein
VLAASAYAATITINTAVDDTTGNGNCTLREAVIAANTNANVDGCIGAGAYGADTINLPAGTYTFAVGGQDEIPFSPSAASGDLDVSESLTIQGAGAATTVIDGNDLDKIFQIHSGTVTINDVTVRNGTNAAGLNGGGIDVCGGTLHLNGSIVESNQTTGTGRA